MGDLVSPAWLRWVAPKACFPVLKVFGWIPVLALVLLVALVPLRAEPFFQVPTTQTNCESFFVDCSPQDGPSGAAQQLSVYPSLELDMEPFSLADTLEPIELRPNDSSFLYIEERRGGLRWWPAIGQSLFFTGIQHAVRLTEGETREGLPGPFFDDWFYAAGTLWGAGWHDGGHDFTNYAAHPAAGSVWGFIYRQNHRTEYNLRLEWSKRYVASTLKAMAWSAVWSFQFEVGPISEASLGNIGSNRFQGDPLAWIDVIITPLVGVGVVSVGEDMLDRWLVVPLENKTDHKFLRGLIRVCLNPTRSFALLMGFRKPWARDSRMR